MTISGTLFTHSNATITINNGSTLIIDNNGVIKGMCDNYFGGTINVEPGGSLILKEGGQILMGEDGLIDVKHGASSDGLFKFDGTATGGELVLNDDNTSLNISGELFIASNITFTFTGSGYIKFSNPGDDQTQNISCGTGASVYLEGSGRNDKIVEVQQSTVRFPDLDNLTFKNGKIEMGNNKRIETSKYCLITMDNIKVTSDNSIYNGHRSIHLHGQNNVTIENSIFEFGKWGLYGNLILGGAPLAISDSEFRYNETGLYIYGKGIHLNNCYFHNNDNSGVFSEAMEFASDITECEINLNGISGVHYEGASSADLTVDHTDVLYNDRGLNVGGSFYLNLQTCNKINNNILGVRALFGTHIMADNYAMNDISLNGEAINLNNSFVSLNDGYNQLHSINDNYALDGTTILFCPIGNPPYMYANHNRWESNASAAPQYGVNHELEVPTCNPSEVNVIDNNPDYLECFVTSPFNSTSLSTSSTGSSLNSPTISFGNSNVPVHQAVNSLSSQSSQLNTLSDYQNIINQYENLLLECNNNLSNQVFYWQMRAWGDLHDVVEKYYHSVNRNNSNSDLNTFIDRVISINNTISSNPALSDNIYSVYQRDNALLNRLRESYDTAYNQLEQLKYEITDQKELAYIDLWQCRIDAEKQAKEGNITPDEFFNLVKSCKQTYQDEIDIINFQDTSSFSQQESGSSEDTIPSANLTITPNPNQGNFTVEVFSQSSNSKIMISNSYSQPVRNIDIMGEGQKTLQVSGLAAGTYTVYYLENDVIKDSENVIVE